MRRFAFACALFLCFKTDCYSITQSSEIISGEDIWSPEDEESPPKLFPKTNDGLNAVFEDLSARFLQSNRLDPTSVPAENDCDDVARQLAGVYVPSEALSSPFRADYADFMDKEWAKLEESSLSKITAWSAENIAPHINGDSTTLFYPFGGPDIAYALRFFPQMQTYVLLGLEPIGKFENIRKNIRRESTFAALKRALSSYLQKGYFITSEMMTQLSNRDVRGTLYLLLIQIVKSGFVVDRVEELSISAEGQEIPRQKGTIDCVKITFRPVEGGASKCTYYIRGSVLDSNGKLSSLTNFMKRFKFTTFIKSASYVLHDRSASKIRNFILENAQTVLQDDAGIPFSHFNAEWDKHIFGVYTQPTLPIFKSYKQKDLANYHASNPSVSIPFKIGYGFNQERPNLTLAIPTRRRAVDGGCPCKNKKRHSESPALTR